MEIAAMTLLEQYIGGPYPLSPEVAEQYRVLFARLMKLQRREDCNIFCISSAMAGEGKTFTAVNLAMTIAEDFRKKVLLMDVDYNGTVLNQTKEDGGHYIGWADVLRNKAELNEALIPITPGHLSLLSVGRIDGSSARLIPDLGSSDILQKLRQQFDYVIMDAPPVIPLADLKLIEEFVDGIILVVRAEETTRDMAKKAYEGLKREKVLGFVLNDVTQWSKGYYGNYVK